MLSLLGTQPDDLCWDGTHHLQGHAHIGGRELVVIAARDEQHDVVVLTPQDWDEIRRAPTQERQQLLCRCAIADRGRLLQVLASAA